MTQDPWTTADDSEFDFDFDRSALEAWQAFSERLAEVLSVMDEGATLSIGQLEADDEADPPLVVFSCGPSGALTVTADAARAHGDPAPLFAERGWTEAGEHRWQSVGTQETSEVVAAAASDVLREVFGIQHPALLAPDELADILTPLPEREDAASTPGVPALSGQTDREELQREVLAVLTTHLGHEPLQDAEGDLALRVGSTMVFVRPSQDAHEVLVFAPLVHDVEGRSRAMEVLSDLNTESRWVRFILIRDRVFATMSVMAAPLVPVHLRRALETISQIGDSIDEHLAEKLRGRTTFPTEPDAS